MTMDSIPTLLIVDDQPDNIQVLAGIMRLDYQILYATSGTEALLIAEKERPDLILLDIMMPGMDGYQVCEKLQAQPETEGIPVIFVTGLGQTQNEARGFDAGAVEYITKPFSPPIVQARVRNHLLLKQAHDTLIEKNRALEENMRLREEIESITQHDLKAPLNAIIGLPDVVLEADNLTPTQRKLIQQIQKTGYRMLEQINRSLDLYRMEQGLYELKPEAILLEPLLRNVRLELESLGEKLGVEVIIQGDKGVAVMGEELLLLSLFANLIKNALEAAPGGSSVTVSGSAGEVEYCVSIHNQGTVPDAIRDRFFEKLTTAGKSGGTGLGTYSARLITEIFGGKITMDSTEEGGTTVTVFIPAAM
jgi:two-component system, sensor histidine kinase and response regulator